MALDLDRSRWLIVVQKLGAAKEQLSKAIALYLDEKDYFCTITLAGAANSLLREMLAFEFQLDPLGQQAKFFAFVSAHEDRFKKTTDTAIKRAENYPPNWLKHYVLRGSMHPERRGFDEDDAAFNVIESTRCLYSQFVIKATAQWTTERRTQFFASPQILRWQDHCDDDSYFE